MPRRLPLVNKLPPHVGDGVIWLGLAAIATLVCGIVGASVIESEAFEALWNEQLALSGPALGLGRVWTIATYGWLYTLGDPLGVVWTLVGLYFLGPGLEHRWGKRGFVRFYALCILGGGVLGGAMAWLTSSAAVITGPTAGLVGLVAAWSLAFPDREVLLMFLLPVRARWLIGIVLGAGLLLVATSSLAAYAVHLGGAAAAWLQLGGMQRWRARRMATAAEAARRKRLDEARQRLRVIPGGRDDDLPN